MSDVLTLWGQGHDTAEIARRIGQRESFVYNTLARMKGQTLKPRAKIDSKVERMCAAYADKLKKSGIVGRERSEAVEKLRRELSA